MWFVIADGLWVEGAKWLDWRLGSGFVCQSLAHELERFFEQNVVIGLLTELMVGAGHESHTFDLRGGLCVPLSRHFVIDCGVFFSEHHLVWVGHKIASALNLLEGWEEACQEAEGDKWNRFNAGDTESHVCLIPGVRVHGYART